MAECIEFVGSRLRGYGRVKRQGRMMYAHRAAWEEANGPIPDALNVLHRCDNPPCINVDHLFLGTQADNVADMIAKGRKRSRPSTGEANGRAKLSTEAVETIRQRHAAGERQVDLAEAFGVSQQLISRITREEAWRGVAAV